jgi:Family of unknown function (DUF5755)
MKRIGNDKIAMLFILFGFGIIIYAIYKSHSSVVTNISISENPNPNSNSWFPNFPYNNLPEDVLLNPYVAPLKDERYFINRPSGAVPINVSTNIGAVDTEYRQLGILTPMNGPSKDNILPVMGRPLFTNRNKYQYYTISNQHNNIKLPISVKGRSALNEYGVDEVYSGDTVYVEGYNDAFKVTMYNNNTIKYLPFL